MTFWGYNNQRNCVCGAVYFLPDEPCCEKCSICDEIFSREQMEHEEICNPCWNELVEMGEINEEDED